MKRRDLLLMPAALGVATSAFRAVQAAAQSDNPTTSTQPVSAPLPVPADGMIPVAFLISEGAVIIDFAGPWEVFESVQLSGPAHHPFRPYTVAATIAPVRTSGGLRIVPEYPIASAPVPKVIVIPAQSEPTEPVLAWLRNSARTADLIMSVCTGAFLLARTGLLSGKEATTHHSAYKEFAMAFPDIQLRRGARFVDLGTLATAGGLSSGIDLALHVVERYFGRTAASDAAYHMEYQGQGWLGPNSNHAYAQARVPTDEYPLCAVCEMDVDKATAARSDYQSRTFYFCSEEHKSLFASSPARFT